MSRIVDSELDFTKHTEPEVVEMFTRLDPQWAPAQCVRLAEFLAGRGYIIAQGITGPGSAVPTPAKLLALIGRSSPFECSVNFGPPEDTGSYCMIPRNYIGLVGSGSLCCDGIFVSIAGHVAVRGSPSVQLNSRLALRQIANVESQDCRVRFDYDVDVIKGKGICLWLADSGAAAELIRIFPKRRTSDYEPRLAA